MKKVKFEDLTVKQLHDICKGERNTCRNCPLRYKESCLVVSDPPEDFNLEVEIELPDEYVKDDVDPVVYAHWIRHERAEEVGGLLIPNYECSHCHEWFRDNRRHCGECGTQMDEEVKSDAVH